MDFDILFPDEREKGKTPLRQSQLVMLRMLKIMDYLCTRHNIQYFLTGGSLLGAIRHKGFIPWDDDLDVGMTRVNYEKFEKLAVLELPYDIFFQNVQTDKFYPKYREAEAKLRDKYSKYTRREDLEKRYKWHNGIQVDIFVYDRAFLPDNHFIYLVNRTFFRHFQEPRSKNKRAAFLKLISKYSPFPLVYASSYMYMHRMVKSGQCYKTQKELEQVIKVKFEDMEASVPLGWESYLKRMYGDYMQLPPVEQQKGHHSLVPPDAFTPCDHSEVLQWSDRKPLESNVINI